MSVLTVSAITADIGGYVGHCAVHPDLSDVALQRIDAAISQGLLIDGAVNSCGDDINLVMTHRHGVDAEPVRCQSGLPAVGEVLEPFANPHYVAGWMRGSHNGPLMPCVIDDAHPARFDGPPRVVGMGFQLADGRLVGPRDMLGDISFDGARAQALEMADYMRRNGPFEPGRLRTEDMEYTTRPQVVERVHERWEPIEEPAPIPAYR
jgi:fructose 1,6-bisphosphatase